MIKLLLVDDQASVRQGLRMRFELESDITVVGEAANGAEAIDLAKDLEPDVIVMDVAMPQLDGITATRQLQLALPQTHIVMLSIYGDTDTRTRARNAGATAFIEKQGEFKLLLNAVYDTTKHKHICR